MRYSLISKFSLIIFVVALFFSCENKEHIRTYRLAKTQDNIQRKNANSEKQSNSKLTWEVSELWEEVPGHSMRLASFQVPCGDEFGDLSVTTLEGSSGSIFANVQRWMGQIGLENATEAEINSLNKIKGIKCLKPNGAFYVFPSCKGLLNKKTKIFMDKKTPPESRDTGNYELTLAGDLARAREILDKSKN